jgi:hypothetical protein
MNQTPVAPHQSQIFLTPSASNGTQKVIDLANQVVSLDMVGLEGELISNFHQGVCAQLGVAVIVAEMKRRWDSRNSNPKFREFFCHYASFADFCSKAYGYAETRCKELVRVGRVITSLSQQAIKQKRHFILPATFTEALNLTKVPEENMFDSWLAYKEDGQPLPITTNNKQRRLVEAKSTALPTPTVQIIRTMAEDLPNAELVAVIASMLNPWNQEEIARLVSQKPAVSDLATMGLRQKHDLAKIFHLDGYQGLIGSDLDNFLIDKLYLT